MPAEWVVEGIPTSKANIVLIIADDVSWNDLGCYSDKVAKTPDIDRLAKEGLRLADIFMVSRPAEELFDVKNDPGQLLNLGSVPECQLQLAQMREALLQWQAQTGDTTPDDLTPDWYDRETGDAIEMKGKRGTMPGKGRVN